MFFLFFCVSRLLMLKKGRSVLSKLVNSLTYFFQLMFKEVKFDGQVRDDATNKLHTFNYLIERDFRLSVSCPAAEINGIPCSSGFGLKFTTNTPIFY